jgi:hypothetical protein
VQSSVLQPAQHGTGLAQRGLRIDRRVEWAVNSHQVARPDELVQLDVVDVAGLAQFWGVQDDEDMVAVGVDLRHAVALD